MRIFDTIQYIFLLGAVIALAGCASANVSRDAAYSSDQTVLGTRAYFNNLENSSLEDSYQNASQTTKGIVLGGLTGAAVGGIDSGVGLMPGLIGGAILGGIIGSTFDNSTTLLDELNNRNVNIIALGDQILIVLYSDQLFMNRTATIYSNEYPTLDLVATYINRFPNMSVKVSAYTRAIGSSRINLALSKEQANSVLKYLWRRGINTRLLIANGYDGSNLVAENTPDWEGSDNDRVEITLQKLPV